MKKIVLVVEDEPQMRKLMVLALKNQGYEVFEAEDTRSATRWVEGRRPDVIVLDAVLPDQMGFEWCTRLRGNPRTTDIPILMVSGITQGVPGSRDVWRRRFQADEFIAKPFPLRELVEGVGRLAGVIREGTGPDHPGRRGSPNEKS